MTNFYEAYCPLFKKEADTEFKIRTKSQSIAPLLKQAPLKNVIIAYSINPQTVIEKIELKTASLENRLKALEKLESLGYSIAIRLDPIIDYSDAKIHYKALIEAIFKRLTNIHSITLGPYRLAKNAEAIMRKKLATNRLVMCQQHPEILDYVKHKLFEYTEPKYVFLCY